MIRATNSGRTFGVSVMAMVSVLQPCFGTGEESTLRPPLLQRVEISDKHSHSFDFSGPRGPGTPVLVRTSTSHDLEAKAIPVDRYYVLGVNGNAYRRDEPFRWGISEEAVFCTFSLPHVHQRIGPTILRFPRQFLVAGPDDGRSAIDQKRLGNRFSSPNGSPAPNYVGLSPVHAALMGFEGWKIGDLPLGDGVQMSKKGHPKVSYDIHGLDASRIELYMTVDGKLSRWLFDGKEWTLRENYAIEIEGPFLVCEQGKSLVTARDGRWCLLKGIDTENPSVTPIIDVSETNPLRLIEDRSARKAFLELGGDLFDTSGKRIARIPKSVKPENRVREIVRNVRAQRE
jgi:hypothetical protein